MINKNTLQTNQQTFLEHVHELRQRLFMTAIFFLVGGTAGYFLHSAIIALLKRPYDGTLYFGTPAGSFNFIMKICLLTGLVVAIPVFIYNLIRFIQPAFKEELMKRTVRRLTLLSAILAAAGMLFAYLLIVPMSLHFFNGFKIPGVQPLITADSYLSFVINALLTFTLIFQIPLVMTFIDRIKPIPPKKLLHYEKYVIVGALAIAVILPFTYDPVTQFVVAVPIIALYNFTIALIALAHRGRRLNHAPAAAPVARAPIQTAVSGSSGGMVDGVLPKSKLRYEI